ncbi:MAG: hypothetical protein ACD_46C00041G0001 [uncultured bacterium]|nr:MAG: hypothetical protein ACD_46C00041G0001 [uncultured bacterium]
MLSGKLVKVSDNLTQVAQEIIGFILKKSTTYEEEINHRDELLVILSSVSQQYQKPSYQLPIISAIETYFMSSNRTRSMELFNAAKEIGSAYPGDTLKFLEVFTTLLKSGQFYGTSANTHLLDEFVKRLIKYESIEQDPRFRDLGWNEDASKMAIRIALRDVLVRKADVTLSNYKKANEANIKINKVELPKKINPLKIDPNLRDLLSHLYGGDRKKQVDKIINEPTILSKPENKVDIIEDYATAKIAAPQQAKLDLSKFSKVIASIDNKYRAEPMKTKDESQINKINLNHFTNIANCIGSKYGTQLPKTNPHRFFQAKVQSKPIEILEAINEVDRINPAASGRNLTYGIS